MEGVCKWFNKDKGFGFIQVEGEDKDYFVHISQLSEEVTLDEGDRVLFTPGENERGKTATNVEKL